VGLFHYLFSYDGRINRAKMWAILLVGLVAEIFVGFAVQATLGFGTIIEVFEQKMTWSAAVAAAPLFYPSMAALYVLWLYLSLAITTKRLHDRNKSIWWLLVFVILPAVLQIPVLLNLPEYFSQLSAIMAAMQNHVTPPQISETPIVTICRGVGTIISLWAFVELFILRGTEGPNRFGQDPLAGKV